MASTASNTPVARKTGTPAPASRKASPATKAKAKPAKPAKAPVVATSKQPAAKKAKLVRDSFTMPKADFDLVDALKARAISFGRPAKKSELLRAGLHALSAMDDAALRPLLAGLPQLKPGRPGKSG